MGQDLSQFTHAYVTYEGTLSLIDTAGEVSFLKNRADRRETDPAAIQAELKRLESDHGFIALKDTLVAINPAHIQEAWYCVDNTLKLRTLDDKNVCTIPIPVNQAEPMLVSLVETGRFIAKPGFISALNIEHLREISFNAAIERLEFKMKGPGTRSNTVQSAPLSPQAALTLLKSYQEKGFPVLISSDLAARATEPEAESDVAPQNEAPKEILRTLAQKIKDRVIGQDAAADTLARAVRRSFAGLKEENKPIGSFLFLGPTGVGKTEITRQLATTMGWDFKKFDMSEYMDKHNVARLIGAPVGYVNSEEGGQLTNFIKAKPRSVILLDEIEKAHPDVINILLQITDDAKLTDGRGNTVDFKDTIIIMTSNLGSSFKKSNSIGFVKAAAGQDDDPARGDAAVRSFFTPELINRLDAVVRFKPLQAEDMARIVTLFIDRLKEKLDAKGTSLFVTPDAGDYLAKKGLDPEFGARPLKRLIQSALEDPLADHLLDGELENGGDVTVRLNEDKTGLDLVFNSAVNDNQETAAPEKPAKPAKNYALALKAAR